MIAGTNLLSEDFRLKRAAEAVEPLGQASPVFARICQLSRSLLDPDQTDKEGVLLDAITLVDALLCTQGAVAASAGGDKDSGDEAVIERLPGGGSGNTVTNAPYSVVSALIEALTSSGSGHFAFVTQTHESRPELFSDYRVKAALVQALGASYSELAYQVEMWLREEDASLLPLLQSQFDPAGKKDMVRRVRVMEAIAPREANPFFLAVLPDAAKEVKQALIFALRHCPENEDLLWDLEKTEKGNMKKTVYQALAYMESSRAEQFFDELCRKKQKEAMAYLRHTKCSWTAPLVARELEAQLKPYLEDGDFVPDQEYVMALRDTIFATEGKTGQEMIQALDKAFRLGIRLNRSTEEKKGGIVSSIINRNRSQGAPYHTLNILADMLKRTLSITADPEMGKFAITLYEEKLRGKENWEIYFPAAALGHLFADEDCSGWLSAQLLSPRRPAKLYESLCNAWSGIMWSEGRQEFVFRTVGRDFDMMDDYIVYYEHGLKQDIPGRIADVLMQCKDGHIDSHLLAKCVNTKNDTDRLKLEEYFYKRALVVGDNRSYLRTLKSLGCRRCEGLAVHYFKNRSGKTFLWELKQFESYYLPGDAKAKYEELQKVYDLIKRGKVSYQNGPGSSEEDLRDYMETLKC